MNGENPRYTRGPADTPDRQPSHQRMAEGSRSVFRGDSSPIVSTYSLDLELPPKSHFILYPLVIIQALHSPGIGTS